MADGLPLRDFVYVIVHSSVLITMLHMQRKRCLTLAFQSLISYFFLSFLLLLFLWQKCLLLRPNGIPKGEDWSLYMNKWQRLQRSCLFYLGSCWPRIIIITCYLLLLCLFLIHYVVWMATQIINHTTLSFTCPCPVRPFIN